MISYLFTSESVAEGHPDKIADQISDSILDAYLSGDRNSHVACETFVTTNKVIIGGEVKTKKKIKPEEREAIVRKIIREIGYTKDEYYFNADNCQIEDLIHDQSPDIDQGVTKGGAGDQGMMFGYATSETPQFMPMPILFANSIVRRLAEIRKKENSLMPYLRPDGKSQVTIEYSGKIPKRVHTIVVAVQHDPNVTQKKIREDVIEHVIKKVIPHEYIDDKITYYINPTGKFEIGGPHGDSGLTGRKIIVDTYGGKAPHGGGAFSGKDPTKVDRSGAYAARHIAKNIVAAEIAEECLIQIAYAIGVSQPISVYINTFGTGKVPDALIADFIKREIDLTPSGIIDRLKLRRPIYRKTATYGHFGRDDEDFTWEKLDLVKLFKKNLLR